MYGPHSLASGGMGSLFGQQYYDPYRPHTAPFNSPPFHFHSPPYHHMPLHPFSQPQFAPMYADIPQFPGHGYGFDPYGSIRSGAYPSSGLPFPEHSFAPPHPSSPPVGTAAASTSTGHFAERGTDAMPASAGQSSSYALPLPQYPGFLPPPSLAFGYYFI
jgi:hypothetical protein